MAPRHIPSLDFASRSWNRLGCPDIDGDDWSASVGSEPGRKTRTQRITATQPRPLGGILAILPFGGYRKHLLRYEGYRDGILSCSPCRFCCQVLIPPWGDGVLWQETEESSPRHQQSEDDLTRKWRFQVKRLHARGMDSKPFLLAHEDEMFKK